MAKDIPNPDDYFGASPTGKAGGKPAPNPDDYFGPVAAPAPEPKPGLLKRAADAVTGAMPSRQQLADARDSAENVAADIVDKGMQTLGLTKPAPAKPYVSVLEGHPAEPAPVPPIETGIGPVNAQLYAAVKKGVETGALDPFDKRLTTTSRRVAQAVAQHAGLIGPIHDATGQDDRQLRILENRPMGQGNPPPQAEMRAAEPKSWFGEMLDKTTRKPLDNSLGGFLLETAGDAVRGAGRGLNAVEGGLWGGVQAGSDLVFGEDSGLSRLASASGRAVTANQASLASHDPDSLTQQVFESTFQNVPVLLGFGAGNKALAAMGALSAGQSYHEAKNAGMSTDAALERAAWQGTAEVIGERLSLPTLGKLFSSAAAGVSNQELGHVLTDLLVKEQAGEQLTTALQDAYDKFGRGGLRKDMTVDDYLKDVVNTAKVTLGQSLLMGGAAGVAKAALAPAQAPAQAPAPAPVTLAMSRIFGDVPAATPEAMRMQTLSVVDSLAKKHGMSPRALEALKQQAETIPDAELAGWTDRAVVALAKRGLVKRPGDLLTPQEAADQASTAQADAMAAWGDLRAAGQPSPAVEPATVPVQQAAPNAPAEAGAADQGDTLDAESLLGHPIDYQAHQAATSPLNDAPEPTQAQKEAGNYQKGHLTLQGLDIAIENPRGSTRRGIGADGTPWETTMQHHYGYIKGTIGNDKDHVDTFIGANPDSPSAFVVDQIDPRTGRFDEHKIVLGADSIEQAREIYQANYAPDWRGLAAITEMPVADFKAWVKDGPKTQPMGDISQAQQEVTHAGNQGEAAAVAARSRDGRGGDAGAGVGGSRHVDGEPARVRAAPAEPVAGGAAPEPARAGSVSDDQALSKRVKVGDAVAIDGQAGKVVEVKGKITKVRMKGGKVRTVADGSPTAGKLTIKPARSASAPKAEKGGPVRGSMALGEIHRRLGGISPDLLPDLSEKVERVRVSRKTGRRTTYVVWDNPLAKGGPLFRMGGSADLTEIARVLSEAGYITPGLYEDDPLGASKEAQEVIRRELRAGGDTLQVGNPDAVDAEMRARMEAEQGDPWEDFTFTRDELEELGYTGLSDDLQAEVQSLLAEADQAGLDTESIRDDIARQVGEEASQDEYNTAVKQALQGVLTRAGGASEQTDARGPGEGDQRSVEADRQAGETRSRSEGRRGGPDQADHPNEGLTLESQTEQDLREKTKREESATTAEKKQRDAEQERLRKEQLGREAKQRADSTVDDFQLGQSADHQLSGMGDMFADVGQQPSSKNKATPTNSPTSTKIEASDSEELRQAKADALKALGDLADIFGKGSKLNMMPEQEQKLLPVLTRLFDAAFRMGYLRFKEAARFALDQIRNALGDDVADQITLEHLQGGYIGMSGRYRDKGADSIKDVGQVATLADIHQNAPQESDRAPSTNPDLERDRQDAGSAKPGVGQAVRDAGRANDADAGEDRGQAGSRGRRRSNTESVGPDSAPLGRERGDQPVRDGVEPPRSALDPSRADDGERSGDLGFGGVAPDTIAAGAVDQFAQTIPEDAAKRRAQREADRHPVEPGDAANIDLTLPYLNEGQRADVFKAETRFAQASGYGMLFTNGTGTGKTFTGLGIAKRFDRQGKSNILITTPDEKIATDWIASGRALGLRITALKSTQDAGEGIVITTYANFGANNALAHRDWDLIITDEAHKLCQDQNGTETTYLRTLRAISLHPRGSSTRAHMLLADQYEALNKLGDQIKAYAKDKGYNLAAGEGAQDATLKKLQARYDAMGNQIRARSSEIAEDVKARQGAARPRVTMLSATPFAYVPTVDMAEGYLFEYSEGQPSEEGSFRGYNSGSNQDRFFMQHFGYRMRTNKLTRPDGKVDSGLMERQFNAWLKKRGVLSGRMLEVEPDYDRRFISVDSAIGNRIDEALEWASEKARAQSKSNYEADKTTGVNGYQLLSDAIAGRFDYQSRRYLLEAIKAAEVVKHVREHMALGRKVVVFHDYKKGGGFNPFNIDRTIYSGAKGEPLSEDQVKAYEAAAAEFRAEFKDLIHSGIENMRSPIDEFRAQFPDVLLINGNEKKADLLERYKRFNDDSSGPMVVLVQSAKNAGWSGHDTTGKHQRVLFNLGQPTAPTMAIQQEGRIYRTGQASDAMFRYLNTGTNWEKWAFATTIAQRASTAENLGMGEQARALKDAFIAAFEESGDFPAGHEGEGKGGKERDRAANNALSPFDRAKAFYFGTQKKDSRTKAQEGTDYFATPEPVGQKMVEWADVRGGEDTLEPSAGHGAIARWLPDNVSKTAIEPSPTLRPRLALVFDGKILGGQFEDLHAVNKFDAVVMNPPFGLGGKTAIEHLAKAATQHLRDGGRLVALIPTGPAADKRFDKWFYEEDTKPAKPLGAVVIDGKETPIYKGDTVESRASWAPVGVVTGWRDGAPLVKASAPEFHGAASLVSGASIKSVKPTGARTVTYRPAEGLNLVADFKLPSVTFERAGTQVATRIVVIDKGDTTSHTISRDLTEIQGINDLFDRIEHMSVPSRAKVDAPVAEPSAPQAVKVSAKAAEKAQAASAGAEVAKQTGQEIAEHVTGKGKTLRGVVRADLTREQAKSIDEFTFKKDGGWFIRDKHVAELQDKFPARGGARPSLSVTGSSSVAGVSGVDQSAAAISREDLDEVIARVSGSWVGVARSEITVAPTPLDLPRPIVDFLLAEKAPLKGVEGVEHDGRVYLVQSNISSAVQAETVLFHEVYGHMGMRLLGAKMHSTLNAIWADIGGYEGVAKIAKRQKLDDGTTVWDRLQPYIKMSANMPAMERRSMIVDELIAFIAQRNDTRALTRFKTYLADLKAAVVSFLRGKGFERLAARLERAGRELDVLALVRDARNAVLKGKTRDGSPVRVLVAGDEPSFSLSGEPAGDTWTSSALAEIGALDVFKHPISDAKTLAGVLADVDPAIEMVGDATREDERDESGADRRTLFRADGRDVYIYEKGREVWIDVSRLDPGQGGDAIYNAVANYAHNTKKEFVGDPAGLSESAIIRRTYHMLGSALRFGTTDHFSPAPEQLKGMPDKGIPPLKWHGNDEQRIQALAHTFTTTLYDRFPGLRGFSYDFNRHAFVDARGNVVTREGLVEGSTGGVGGSAGINRRTAAAGVLISSLSRAPSSERPRLLASILRNPAQLEGAIRSAFSLKPGQAKAEQAAAQEVQQAADKGYRAKAKRIVARADGVVNGLGQLPDQQHYLAQRYRAMGRIASIDKVAGEIRQAFRAASKEDKAAIYEYLTTAGADTSGITSPEVRDMAAKVKAYIGTVGDALVKRGLLSEEAREEYRDRYLPRLYLSHLLSEGDWRAIGSGKKVSDMGYLKQRKEIPDEVRRVILGEIKDPAFLAASAVAKPMRDMALLDWLSQISAHDKWIWPESMIEVGGGKASAFWLKSEAEALRARARHYPEQADRDAALKLAEKMDADASAVIEGLPLDHEDYKQIPNSPRYGRLRGLLVRREIYDDLMGAQDFLPKDPGWAQQILSFGGYGTRLTQAWKMSKVSLNIPGQIRNMVSNLVMLQLSGVPLHRFPIVLSRAIRSIRADGKHWQVAKKYGVTEGTFQTQELYRAKRDLLELERDLKGMTPLVAIKTAAAFITDLAGDAYQRSEAFVKTAKIVHAMEYEGLSESDAAIEAQKWLFDYSLVNRNTRYLRNSPIGMPFLTYQTKVAPRLIEVAALHPHRFLPWLALMYGMQAWAMSAFGGDPEEWEQLKKALPQWMQEKGHIAFLPWRDGNGRLQAVDLSYFFPWSQWTEFGGDVAQGELGKAMQAAGLFGGPITGLVSALTTNVDSFTKRPIYNAGDPSLRQATDVLAYAYDMAVPPMISTRGVASPLWLIDSQYGGKLADAVSGRTNRIGAEKSTKAQAFAALAGLNTYGIDPEQSRKMNMLQLKSDEEKTKARMRGALSNLGLSQAQRADVAKEYREELIWREKKQVEYARQSKVPEFAKRQKDAVQSP